MCLLFACWLECAPGEPGWTNCRGLKKLIRRSVALERGRRICFSVGRFSVFSLPIFFCGGRESGQVGTFQCLVSIVTEKGGTTLTKNNMILCYPNLPSNISSVLSTRNTDPCFSQRCRCALQTADVSSLGRGPPLLA